LTGYTAVNSSPNKPVGKKEALVCFAGKKQRLVVAC
jgi:hypothetical protein